MNKLTPNYLYEYLNKWNIPSNDITIKNLSSSEKMKFILAATSWKNPDVLVLDEPTNHLDSTELRNLSNFIKSYHGGIVIATNNEQFARENMKIFLEIHNGIIHINN
jgi:ATP-binding cassette subfamily F protein 3